MITVNIAQIEHGSRILTITEKTKVFNKIEIETVGELWDEYLTKGEASGYSYLVAQDDGVVTGYTCFGPHALTAGAYDLYWIAVDPDHQNKGIGGALIQRVEQEVEQLQGNLLILETSSTSLYQPARDFYARAGFVHEATIHDFYAPDDHLEIFTKHLGKGKILSEDLLLQIT